MQRKLRFVYIHMRGAMKTAPECILIHMCQCSVSYVCIYVHMCGASLLIIAPVYGRYPRTYPINGARSMGP
jgi:hypothetical protein